MCGYCSIFIISIPCLLWGLACKLQSEILQIRICVGFFLYNKYHHTNEFLMEQHLPEVSPHPTKHTQKFYSIGNSLHILAKLAHYHYLSWWVLSDVLFFCFFCFPCWLRLSLIFFFLRVVQIRRKTNRQRGPSLKRAGNHHLYNCFNLDIQIASNIAAIYTRTAFVL